MTNPLIGQRHPSVGSVINMLFCNLQGTAHRSLPQGYKMIEGAKKTAFPSAAQVRCDPSAQSPQPVVLASVGHPRRPVPFQYP